MKETNWVEVRIPIEIRALIPDMPTRIKLLDRHFWRTKYVEIVNETPEIFAPLPTPPGYVRKITRYHDTISRGPIEPNRMTNLQTFRQNRSGRMSDMVRPGEVEFENMSYTDYHYPGFFSRLDMEGEKRILRDGLLYVAITNDNRIDIKNKYFESGRGFHLRLTLYPSKYLAVEVTIISKKQLRPEPRAPSTRPRKRRRNV